MDDDGPSQVCLYRCKPGRRDGGHEHLTHRALAKRLAAWMGAPVGPELDAGATAPTRAYLLPDDTITSISEANRVGIQGPAHFFGGVVPWPFAATKVITHSLIRARADAPRGWSTAFGEQVRSVVLPGYSTFARSDAQRAGVALLAGGKVRLKRAGGIGGAGQTVVADEAALADAVRQLLDDDAWQDGLVLERDLNDVVTHSVGQVRAGDMLVSYCGLQRLTRNHRGDAVYGGSTLQMVRGDYEAMSRLELDGTALLAVQQARAYQQAAFACFEGMFASRCNYDVAQGVDDSGAWQSGVLEQSWRVGGASGAELAALVAFAADPSLQRVSASTHEVHGEHAEVPADAVVDFHGVDEITGPLLKYSRVETV